MLPEEVVVKRPKKSRQRGRKVVTEDARDKSLRPSILMFLAIGFLAMGVSVSLLAISFSGAQSRANSSLRSELQAAQSRTGELSALAAGSIDMEEVERVARSRLGMSEPQIHQIRYINIPRQNFMTMPLETVNIEADYSNYQAASTGLINLINIFTGD